MPAYIRVTLLTVPVCALHHRNVSVMIQNFPNCPIHSKVSVWDNMLSVTRRVCTVAVPNPPRCSCRQV